MKAPSATTRLPPGTVTVNYSACAVKGAISRPLTTPCISISRSNAERRVSRAGTVARVAEHRDAVPFSQDRIRSTDRITDNTHFDVSDDLL